MSLDTLDFRTETFEDPELWRLTPHFHRKIRILPVPDVLSSFVTYKVLNATQGCYSHELDTRGYECLSALDLTSATRP